MVNLNGFDDSIECLCSIDEYKPEKKKYIILKKVKGY